jgi:hypothetical protein
MRLRRRVPSRRTRWSWRTPRSLAPSIQTAAADRPFVAQLDPLRAVARLTLADEKLRVRSDERHAQLVVLADQVVELIKMRLLQRTPAEVDAILASDAPFPAE